MGGRHTQFYIKDNRKISSVLQVNLLSYFGVVISLGFPSGISCINPTSFVSSKM